jgi:NAD(P)-dependent dehydrogenase (short-subunit alcohol dehydrogenase family)
MSDSLQERHVVVVGASSGLGRGVAIRAVQGGARVILAARRIEELERAIDEAGGGQAVVTDLRSDASCRHLAERVACSRPPVDLLVVSAGSAPLRRMRLTTADDWQLALETNVVGINRVIAALFDHLAPHAVVAVVSSEVVGSPRSHLGAYGASKAALEHSIAQWQEEHPWLRFTTVSLGATVPTQFGQAFATDDLVEAFGAWTAAGQNPSGFMDTDEVCGLLVATLGGLVTAPSVGMPRMELHSPAPAEPDNETGLAAAKASRETAPL